MIRKIVPLGWPTSLRAAPPGPFVTLDNPELLCFKSEYSKDSGAPEALNSAGEYFCGDDTALIQPVMMIEDDSEDEQ